MLVHGPSDSIPFSRPSSWMPLGARSAKAHPNSFPCQLRSECDPGLLISYDLCQALRLRFPDRLLRALVQRLSTIRIGEGARRSRRSLRLPCGGWVPHDDGASEGCLVLSTDVGVAACPKSNRGFPLPWPASSLTRIVRCASLRRRVEHAVRSTRQTRAIRERPRPSPRPSAFHAL